MTMDPLAWVMRSMARLARYVADAGVEWPEVNRGLGMPVETTSTF